MDVQFVSVLQMTGRQLPEVVVMVEEVLAVEEVITDPDPMTVTNLSDSAFVHRSSGCRMNGGFRLSYLLLF